MEEKLDKIIGLLEQIAEIERTPSKSSGAKWSEAETDKLLELFEAGYSTGRITVLLSKEFNTLRSVYAVNLKIIEQIKSRRPVDDEYVVAVKKSNFKKSDNTTDGVYDNLSDPPW